MREEENEEKRRKEERKEDKRKEKQKISHDNDKTDKGNKDRKVKQERRRVTSTALQSWLSDTRITLYFTFC
jgi:hypothetical protein